MENHNNKLLGLLFTLNILDAIFTIAWIEMGVATEANPLLKPIAHTSLIFMLVKIAVGTLCGLILKDRVNRITKTAIHIGLLVYIAVTIYHICILFAL